MKKTNKVLIKILRVNGMFFFLFFFVVFFLKQFGLHAAGRRYCYIFGTYGLIVSKSSSLNIKGNIIKLHTTSLPPSPK